MNISIIKKYAPKACEQISEAMEKHLHIFGISTNKDGELEIAKPVILDSAIQTDNHSLNSKYQEGRERLVRLAQQTGYTRLVEQAAFTWFNRLCAIRYMELHDYLGHGFRVLSHPEQKGRFEIHDHAQDAADELDLDRDHIIELKLAGNKDEELYRELLLAQCHQLHKAMPFLFGGQGDELELLLPDNLTRTDSLIRSLVDDLPEVYWQSLDLFPLLFEHYYSNYKKTIGRKAGKAELPVETQVCEPKWVSQFMVENTLARRWKEINPASKIDEELAYYLSPTDQPESVAAHLVKISENTPKSPENIRVLEPACGSGSNLLHAYELLYKIYQEEGYRSKEIPQIILSQNLVGLDIDDRACQITSLVLMLRAREDDRRIFTRGFTPSVFNLTKAALSACMGELPVKSDELGYILAYPEDEPLQEISNDLEAPGDAETALKIMYDVIICYPPNLGIQRTHETLASLKSIATTNYVSTKSNLATMFVERALTQLKPDGFCSFVLKDSWLFLSRYEKMRNSIFEHNSIECLAHLGRGVIPGLHRMNVAVLRGAALPGFSARYCLTEKTNLTDENHDGDKQLPVPKIFPVVNERLTTNTLSRMSIVPTKPVSYWLPSALQTAFLLGTPFGEIVTTEREGKKISRDESVRQWYELESSRCDINSDQDESMPWKQMVSGGSFRRWYGNLNAFVNTSSVDCKRVNEQANTWTALTSVFNTRSVPAGSCYDGSGPCFSQTSDKETRQFFLGLTNSKVFDALVHAIFPEDVLGSIRAKDLAEIPVVDTHKAEIAPLVEHLVTLAKDDWHSVETSWGFVTTPWLGINPNPHNQTLQEHYQLLEDNAKVFVARVRELETSLNREVIHSYNLEGVISPDLAEKELAYYNNPYFFYADKTKQTDEEYEKNVWESYRASMAEALVSYGIGCIVGRYHSENKGVAYAESGNRSFDEIYDIDTALVKPDADGIVPLTDIAWFKDDAAEQFRDWLKIVFGAVSLDSNLKFIAESLATRLAKKSFKDGSFEMLRHYLVRRFYKYHLTAYQRRPVYWLFSSGREKAFECLVYLHRYNEGTLARMRTEYVTPLFSKLVASAEYLQKQIENAPSTVEANRLKKELVALEKKQAELGGFDDRLKHYADMCIKLDLDDGVKVNYGKFGDLLADVKAVTGKNPEMS